MLFKKPTAKRIGKAAAMSLGSMGGGLAKKALAKGPKSPKPMKFKQKQAPMKMAKKGAMMMKKMPKKR